LVEFSYQPLQPGLLVADAVASLWLAPFPPTVVIFSQVILGYAVVIKGKRKKSPLGLFLN